MQKLDKQFNDSFKDKLYDIISEIENNSLVEVVTIIKQESGNYKDTGFLVSSITTGIILTFLMLVPIDINPYLIYIFTIISFVMTYLLVMNISGLLRLFISTKRQTRNVEIMSRATFQKGGIRHTQAQTGVLFYISILEQKVAIVADKGIEKNVPIEEIETIQTEFDKCFSSPNISASVLDALLNTKAIFNQYVPPVENDINELPDNLNITF